MGEQFHAARETAASLKVAGIGVGPPGAWGRRPPAKPANGVTTGSDVAKPANTNTKTNTENLSHRVKAKAKPANADEVIAGFGVELSASEHQPPQPVPSTSFSESFREAIELGLSPHHPTRATSAATKIVVNPTSR